VIVKDMTTREILDYTKQKMRDQCLKNVKRINFLCAYRGKSLADHKECFDASKEFIRYGFLKG